LKFDVYSIKLICKYNNIYSILVSKSTYKYQYAINFDLFVVDLSHLQCKYTSSRNMFVSKRANPWHFNSFSPIQALFLQSNSSNIWNIL